jgi:hypothetical protein
MCCLRRRPQIRTSLLSEMEQNLVQISRVIDHCDRCEYDRLLLLVHSTTRSLPNVRGPEAQQLSDESNRIWASSTPSLLLQFDIPMGIES